MAVHSKKPMIRPVEKPIAMHGLPGIDPKGPSLSTSFFAIFEPVAARAGADGSATVDERFAGVVALAGEAPGSIVAQTHHSIDCAVPRVSGPAMCR